MLDFEHALTILLSSESDPEYVGRAVRTLRLLNGRLHAAEWHRANLLARIFRDGGQKAASFSNVSEACAAADNTVAAAYARLGEFQRAGTEVLSVLFFCAQLLCDHEPLCSIKQGGDAQCDCDALLKETDPPYHRVRGAIGLLARLLSNEGEKREQTPIRSGS